MQTLKDKLAETRALLDDSFDKKLTLPEGKEKRLVEAMRYSAIGGGKAFRAFLVLTISEILNLKKETALQIGETKTIDTVYEVDKSVKKPMAIYYYEQYSDGQKGNKYYIYVK